MNRINILFSKKQNNVLAIYTMAGYPSLMDTRKNVLELAEAGADLIEIGIPFSDPIADGPTIQAAGQQALQQGMNLDTLFFQLENIRSETEVPIVLMGYVNPVLQFGVERFCQRCAEVGVDGVILPDMPPAEYENHYRNIFEKTGLHAIFLVTPRTSEERIRQLDAASGGFLYAVSSASTTGGAGTFGDAQKAYFQRLANMGLKNPVLVGFGISDKKAFETVCEHANGAVVGSAFLRAQEMGGSAGDFVNSFLDLNKLSGEQVSV